jgi:hypothetical protein
MEKQNAFIGKIWDSKYVDRLGILDHAHELHVINDEIIRSKNSFETGTDLPAVSSLRTHFDYECVDLFIILSKYLDIPFEVSDVSPALERLQKFAEKAAEEK